MVWILSVTDFSVAFDVGDWRASESCPPKTLTESKSLSEDPRRIRSLTGWLLVTFIIHSCIHSFTYLHTSESCRGSNKELNSTGTVSTLSGDYDLHIRAQVKISQQIVWFQRMVGIMMTVRYGEMIEAATSRGWLLSAGWMEKASLGMWHLNWGPNESKKLWDLGRPRK